jgi:sec-independent protein translocase protein TatA
MVDRADGRPAFAACCACGLNLVHHFGDGDYEDMLGFNHTELLLFGLIVLVLFGSAKLPALMRNLGRSAVEFKKGMREDPDQDAKNRTEDQ